MLTNNDAPDDQRQDRILRQQGDQPNQEQDDGRRTDQLMEQLLPDRLLLLLRQDIMPVKRETRFSLRLG